MSRGRHVAAQEYGERPSIEDHEPRSPAQLRMLHALAARLNRLNEIGQIGEAITAELHTLIDYHSCRVYLLEDGESLEPIAFQGENTEYQSDTYEALKTKVGEGITGHVAATGESLLTPNAMEVEFAEQIPGTPDVDESMLAVPMRYGDRVTGVIVLSSLGVGQFDDDDMRLLEVLASHAAGAFENARLLALERESAETSTALLGLSQALTGVHETEAVLDETLGFIPRILGVERVLVYLRNADTRAFHLARLRGYDDESAEGIPQIPEVSPEVASEFLLSVTDPFVLPKETVARFPEEHVAEQAVDTLIAPLHWEPDGFGAIVVPAPPERETRFSELDLRLARGIADLTSLALGNARRFHELERFQLLVESLKAIFWESDAGTLQFTFMSHRGSWIIGGPVTEWLDEPRRWGDHVHPKDRDRAVGDLRRALERRQDFQLEYRALGPDGENVWLRDMVHVVIDLRNEPAQLRGLVVDITDRKRAEEALRKSEQTYSEAFNREREATRRLRALDDMKNTFLEAVSHELRTPLTSILGSALTLEHASSLATEDASDLIARIATNARKLERLLSDLLDLDRLQRGILTPQLRESDVSEIVREAVRDSGVPDHRTVAVDDTSVVAWVDPAKVERIVENLVANAVRHTPPDAHVWIHVQPKQGGVIISVEDDGPGVLDAEKERIFEPFGQGSGSGGPSPGVGVGLSLVARFAELHGGRAWVEDRPGGGACFRVLLPGP